MKTIIVHLLIFHFLATFEQPFFICQSLSNSTSNKAFVITIELYLAQMLLSWGLFVQICERCMVEWSRTDRLMLTMTFLLHQTPDLYDVESVQSICVKQILHGATQKYAYIQFVHTSTNYRKIRQNANYSIPVINILALKNLSKG